jgi:hypothetical protein
MASRELRQVFLGGLVVLEQEHRRFRNRPLEMGVADLLAAGAVPFAIRFLRTRDQAAGGDERLDPGEAGDRLELIAPHQGQDGADPGNGAPERQRHRIMAVGGLLDRALQRGEERIVNIDQGHVHRHGLLHAAVLEALEEAAAVLGRGDAAQRVAQVILAGRILEVRVELGPLVHEMIAAAQQIACGAPPARVDVRLRNETSTQ